MLTKKDLQAIDNLIEQKLGPIHREVKKIDSRAREVKKIDYLSSQVKKIDSLAREVKKINANIRKIHRDIKVIIELFDDEYLGLRARVERIEEHLHLPPFPSDLS